MGKKGEEGGTPLSHLAALYPGRKEQELRGHLGSFQIKGHLATQPLSTLSGTPLLPFPAAVVHVDADARAHAHTVLGKVA